MEWEEQLCFSCQQIILALDHNNDDLRDDDVIDQLLELVEDPNDLEVENDEYWEEENARAS